MFEDLVKALRTAVGPDLPLVGVGRIVDPDMAERWVADGICDLVAMTRAQIADPDVVAKVAAGRADRIRPCVGANQGCVDRMEQALPITCFHNPDVGREHRIGDLTPAASPRQVLVVGAGPAGMRAAVVAARRGHQVTLVDEAPRCGGRLHWATTFGPASELAGAVSWLRAELRDLAVTVELGRRWSAHDIVAHDPDAVIVATGSIAPDPALEGLDASIQTWTTDDALERDPPTAPVLVVDHLATHEAMQAAERLAAAGCQVTLVTPGPVVGAKVGFTHLRAQRHRLRAAGVDVRLSTTLDAASNGIARRHQVLTGVTEDVAVGVVVAAVPRLAADTLVAELAAAAPALDVFVAGDAVAPRTAMHAFREGDDAGRAV